MGCHTPLVGFAKAGFDLENIDCAEAELNAAARRAYVLFKLISMYPRQRFQDANEEGAGRPPPLRRHGQARALHEGTCGGKTVLTVSSTRGRGRQARLCRRRVIR